MCLQHRVVCLLRLHDGHERLLRAGLQHQGPELQRADGDLLRACCFRDRRALFLDGLDVLLRARDQRAVGSSLVTLARSLSIGNGLRR